MLVKNLPVIVLYVFLIAFGFSLRCIISYQISDFSLDKNINIVDLTSLFLTLFLAYLVYAVLDKNKETRVKEKDIIINRIQEIYDFVQTVSLTHNDSRADFTPTVANLKRLHRHFVNIDKIVKLTTIDMPSKYKDELLTLTRDLKSLMTSTLQTAEIQDYTQAQIPIPISISEGQIIYSAIRNNEILVKFDDIKNKIIEYQFEVNKF